MPNVVVTSVHRHVLLPFKSEYFDCTPYLHLFKMDSKEVV
jgi:hypothetical protein